MTTLFTKQDPIKTINETHDLEWIETLRSNKRGDEMTQCSEQGYRAGDIWHTYQCLKTAVVERDGKPYCKVHDPEYIKAKKADKETRDKANSCSRCGRLFREKWYSYCPLCGTKRNIKESEQTGIK